jgi:hypothetical protein
MTIIPALAILSTLRLAASGPAPRPTTPGTSAESRHPCRGVHTFDFWIGDFEARPWNEPDGAPTGRLHNTLEYDGCAIVERWDGISSGIRGMSISFYDTNRRDWRMVWIADDGLSNDFEGTYSDGAMRFRGWVLDDHGMRVLASNVLQNVSPGTIRHVYSTSADGGKTWDVRSDGRFVRVSH